MPFHEPARRPVKTIKTIVADGVADRIQFDAVNAAQTDSIIRNGTGTSVQPHTAGELTHELVRAGSLLARENDARSLASVLVEQSVDITRSDIGALYLAADPEKPTSSLKLVYRRGRFELPRTIQPDAESVSLVSELRETLVLHDRDRPHFKDALLNDRMRSAIVAPLAAPRALLGVLILNAAPSEFYRYSQLRFVESFVPLAAGMLHNSELLDQLREQLRKVEALERYQESIFASMTNLLVTTDRRGTVQYFNRAAAERLDLQDEHIGKPLSEVFGSRVDSRVLNALEQSGTTGDEQLGIEGIISGRDGREIDFSLNVSPLQGKRGRHEGITLLLTDQTAERELKGQMKVVKEERRLVKDMFARYLSNDLVENLIQQPNSVRLGGDKKLATTFFADIRGYTSFSEGKDPEHIITVLNAYFQEAVEVIINYRGFIDKFIGDAIMAIWGVPLQSEEQDAINAVSCALEIQDRISSPKRAFFTGDASNLRVGIGMHTGPLVAGNLGSTQRMDYSVIGDSVNVAARLESIAQGGQVIITQDTRDMIGDRFKLQELDAVQVKGKKDPITIFRVIRMVR